jgi:hypothetical protein
MQKASKFYFPCTTQRRSAKPFPLVLPLRLLIVCPEGIGGIVANRVRFRKSPAFCTLLRNTVFIVIPHSPILPMRCKLVTFAPKPGVISFLKR